MASLKHSLMVVLSGLLVTGGYSFPSLRLLFQDGVAGNDMKAHSLHAEPPLVAAGQWEWKAATSHKSPSSPRRKRDVVFPTNSSLVTATLHEDETETPLVEEDETTEPGLAGNHSSTVATTTSSSSRETSTEAAVVRLSTGYKLPLHGQTTTASLSEDFTETEGAQDGRRPPHTSAAPSQALVATSTTSVATSATSVATLEPGAKSGVRTAGNTGSSLSPPMTSTRLPTTVQVRPPSREGPQEPDKMVGQCLLAISLLALVAAIFIITTFVLIGLLLRQKRAYKLRQRNKHTEMVCISSLLAAEEAEARGQAPRAKRVKMLAENGSETDIDNLTLNSFLPDH